MKLTKLALAALVASFSGSAFAQFEGTSWEQRIGTGQDSIDTRQNLSIFQMSYENKEWQEAYTAWKAIIEKAPCAQKGVYTKGAFVLYNLIALENQKEKAQQDSLKKIQYFNDLMMLFDTRAKNLDALNSFEAEKGRSTLGDVLSLKADYYNWTAPTVAGCGYTLNKSYDNYSQAIKMINEKGGREIEGSMLQNFFLVSDAMYKSNPNAMRERYLQDYLDSKDACEKMLQLAKEAQAEGDTTRAEQLLQKYDGPLAFIEQTFTQSGAADREQIINVYTKKLDSYKEDINKLNSALNLMAQNDCDDSDIYYQYAQAAYAIQPTYQSAIGCAQFAQKQEKTAESAQYYDKALELATNDNVKGAICLRISKALAATDSEKSMSYVDKAIAFNPDLAGKAYLQQAINMVHAGKLPEAVAFCDKAAESDITVSGSAERLKANIQHAQAVNAENAKKKAEYDEYKANQKKEEDFWNAGKK